MTKEPVFSTWKDVGTPVCPVVVASGWPSGVTAAFGTLTLSTLGVRLTPPNEGVTAMEPFCPAPLDCQVTVVVSDAAATPAESSVNMVRESPQLMAPVMPHCTPTVNVPAPRDWLVMV